MSADLLIATLRDSHVVVSDAAISILVRQRVIQAIPAYLERLLSDPDSFGSDYSCESDDVFCQLSEAVRNGQRSYSPLFGSLSFWSHVSLGWMTVYV